MIREWRNQLGRWRGFLEHSVSLAAEARGAVFGSANETGDHGILYYTRRRLAAQGSSEAVSASVIIRHSCDPVRIEPRRLLGSKNCECHRNAKTSALR